MFKTTELKGYYARTDGFGRLFFDMCRTDEEHLLNTKIPEGDDRPRCRVYADAILPNGSGNQPSDWTIRVTCEPGPATHAPLDLRLKEALTGTTPPAGLPGTGTRKVVIRVFWDRIDEDWAFEAIEGGDDEAVVYALEAFGASEFVDYLTEQQREAREPVELRGQFIFTTTYWPEGRDDDIEFQLEEGPSV